MENGGLGGVTQIKGILGRHAPRVDTLELEVTNVDFDWLSEPKDFPVLRRLTIGHSLCSGIGHRQHMPTFAVVPRLREVTLSASIPVRSFLLPWSQLTVFTGRTNMTTSECLRVLIDAPLLTRCRFVVIPGTETPDTWSLTHTSLEELALSDTGPLNSLTLPNLRLLELSLHLTTDGLPEFIKRSAASLRELTLRFLPHLRDNNPISIDWVWPARELTAVSLLEISDEFASEFLQALQHKTDPTDARWRLLPHLRQLELQQLRLTVDSSAVEALRSRGTGIPLGVAKLRSVRLLASRAYTSSDEYPTHWTELNEDIDWDGLHNLGMDGMDVHVGSPDQNFLWDW
ncbi:hypothetical protein K438DRAFT_1931360 [Mycena galopus ATCC 62051]|nr:hypothetical protein K438DRAFT_1931360 [Mycena galopus ATCC 62051]